MRCFSLSITKFSEYIVRNNALNKQGFKEWVFCPGMLFNSMIKWWGIKGKRSRPHEGLDLFMYSDMHDKVHYLDHTTKIPSAYDGVVVKIMDDFLGKSIFIEHGAIDKGNKKFCTFYGHTYPLSGLNVGDTVREGDVIADIADTRNLETGILPHLHISLGIVPQDTSFRHIDWNVIGDPDIVTLLNPLQLMDRSYQLLMQESPPCQNM